MIAEASETSAAEIHAAESETAEDLSAEDGSGKSASENQAEGEIEEQAPTAFGVPVTQVRSQQVLHPAKEEFAELAATLKTEGYCQCVDLCAVDYLTNPNRGGLPVGVVPERFEVVAVFITHSGGGGHSSESAIGSGDVGEISGASSVGENGWQVVGASGNSAVPHRIRARIQVPEDNLVLPSITHIYPGTENMEREIYDMFGIGFQDHPDMTRILMPDEWEGHPLRRDYAVGQVPVQFKGAPS